MKDVVRVKTGWKIGYKCRTVFSCTEKLSDEKYDILVGYVILS